MKGYIYKIINKTNNKCYIGQSKSKIYNKTGEYNRALSHFSYPRLTRPNWHDDLSLHPEKYECYVIELLESEDENVLANALNCRERYNIIINDCDKRIKGYNKTKGGDQQVKNIIKSNELTLTPVNIRIK